MTGRLVIVPTPIGNLGDLTPRAADALESSDVIYSEDTRVTRKLLSACEIRSKAQVLRMDENAMSKRVQDVISQLEQGKDVAYCTDAGMPGVSDPGMRLVRAARNAGMDVEVLPGPSAAVVAYVASGSSSPSYYFGGFLPRKDADRIALLESLSGLDAALVFYESPHRAVKSLAAIAEALPCRRVCVCRELTKLHEEVECGPAAEIAAEFEERSKSGGLKGEFAIVVDCPGEEERLAPKLHAERDARRLAARLLAEGVAPREAVKRIVGECGVSRNAAYEMVLAEKGQSDG